LQAVLGDKAYFDAWERGKKRHLEITCNTSYPVRHLSNYFNRERITS
jgi:hypothetical protein